MHSPKKRGKTLPTKRKMVALEVAECRHLDWESRQKMNVNIFFSLLITINTAIHYCDECRAKRTLCGDQAEGGKINRANKSTIRAVNWSFDNFNKSKSKSKSERNYQSFPQSEQNSTKFGGHFRVNTYTPEETVNGSMRNIKQKRINFIF